MRDIGQRGSIVTLMCDRLDRYDATFDDDDWLRQRLDFAPYLEVIETAWSTQEWVG
ncbi:MAG: hypothetical protein HZY75_04815 [Nocardioidaceae bacterium]|nr:MAG: hypothetical protein HZY75_04815 [Nocardioidaceae bacterium]